eukprot:gene394-2423_t
MASWAFLVWAASPPVGAKIDSDTGFRWPDTSNNVHSFITFDSGVSPADVNMDRLYRYDFVWGGERNPPSAYHSAVPSIVVAKYIPYAWDPDPTRSLTWWQSNHPSWVLYKCDRKTPAWYPGLVGRNMPLDISNPAVVEWQADTYAGPAGAGGYDAIAADMFGLYNSFGACGVWRGAGQWAELYPRGDAGQ